MSKCISKTHTFLRKKSIFPFQIAIIPQGKPVLLRDMTLNILKAYRIPLSNITIFTNTTKEEKSYTSVLFPGTYGKIIVTSTSNTADHYNSIQNYYLPGTPIVYIKDTIKYILEYNSSTNEIKPLKSLLELCKKGFQECQKENARLWGLCPSFSQMKNTVYTDLSYIPGALWGSINPGLPGIHYKITNTVKEDYERSLKYYISDRSVIRLNMVCVIEYKTPVNPALQESAVKSIQSCFPDLTFIKKSNPTELYLRETHAK